MTNYRFRKEEISIHNIGLKRFWIGVISGILTAISLSLFFNYSRETLRFMTGMSPDLLILKENELLFFNYFFSVLSSVMALSVTIWIWMRNVEHKSRSDKRYKQFAGANALVIFWLILMVISRFGSILPMVLLRPGYDDHLNFYEEYWMLFVLIPIVVFAQNWSFVRLVYHSGKWILISFFMCLLTAFVLQKTTTVDQDKLNKAYHHRYQTDYQYIDLEVKSVAINYGVVFDQATIQILKKWYAESSVEQVVSVKTAFAANGPVSLDTIILQKMIIRNYKHGGWATIRSSMKNWHYALPLDILKQLNYFDINSDQTKELFEILKEQIDLVNTPEIDRERRNYTETQYRRFWGAKYYIPSPLIQQLKEVRTRLMNNNHYSNLAKDLPEIKERE